MAGRDGPPRERHNSPRKSRLLRYLRESQELNLDEMTSEFEDQLALIDADEGYPDSPPADFHLNLEATGRPEDMLVDTTNVVILSNVPDPPHGIAAFASDTLKNCGIDETKVTVKPSKLKNILFFYDLDASSQKKLVLFIKKHHKGVSCKAIMGVSPHRFMDDTTEVILNILRKNQTEQMSYREIYERTPSAYLFLTEDFPYDTNRLVELNRSDFYGMRVRQMYQKLRLDRRHLMSLINVRSLAPLVHKMISAEPTPLDRNFLEVLHQNILDNALEYRRSAIYACGVHGDDLKKPLEHLVTCVPGVEVIWTADRKVIRKLELPERAVAEPAPRAQAATNAPPDAMRQEQEIVKSLSDILKRPSNLYMTLDDLEIALRRCSVRVDRTFSLRQFITERPKHFQILGERDYEVVTLSHRAQIKRVCNDLQKVLRPRKPKCISSAEIAIEFTRHWRSANELDRRFNVEDFGVCYLDDLLVTIPQHWGVHCSEYVSTDGKVVRRTKGNGEEDIPDFVLENPRETVNAWIPRHHQTEAQKKSLALLKQQVLNMFRGDPTADELIHYLTHQNRGHGPEHNRLIRLAYLRANHHQGVPHHGRDNPTLPFNFELEEKTFVPLYHRFCGEQVALVNFGVKDLFELFDSMQDTFEANGQGQERTIRLTSNARREILERRLIDVLRRAKRPMRFNELLQSYESEPTMKPYCNVGHLRTALEMSKLIETKSVYGNLYEAKPIFSCAGAVAAQPDVRHVLLIFMLSYAPLRVARIRDKFTERTGRPLDDSILSYLENAGAIRRVDVYDQLYDLHDICRVVRNLVYKMNELPNKIFIVESHPYLAPNQQSGREVSIASLLSFTGDFTFIKPSALLQIMNDFGICFEALNGLTFRLRPELMVWVPAPEEAEANQGRRGARGAHQGHRGVSQNRRGPRGAHQSHRGGNRSR